PQNHFCALLSTLDQNFADLGASRRGIHRYASLDATTSSEILVGLGGLEPPTSPLSGVRSNHLSYRPKHAGLQSPFCSLYSANQVIRVDSDRSVRLRLRR